jgi:putative DNA primase/helicase
MRYLSTTHRDQLHESGLSDETIELADLETEKDVLRVYERLGWEVPKRWRKNPVGDWLLLPHFEPGASEPYTTVVRPDHPRTAKKTGRLIKYESPKADDSPVYFGPRARAHGWYAGDGLKVWTEGVKKQLLLEQLGHTCVGLSGVWNAHDSAHHKNTAEFNFHPLIAKHVHVAGCDHVICFDSDARENESVMRAAQTLARMLIDAGATRVRLALPPVAQGGGKLGVDDFYTVVERQGESGVAAVQKLFADAEEVDLSAFDSRPCIILSTNEDRVIAEASKVIANAPEIYVRNCELVRVMQSDVPAKASYILRALGSPTIGKLPHSQLRTILTRDVRIVGLNSKDELEPKHPPCWLVEGIASKGKWEGMRTLVGLTDSPVIRQDGSIAACTGYDEQSGLYLALPPEVEGLTVAENPSRALCKSAADCLLRLISDMPIEDDAGRMAWLAGLLTSFGRDAFEGSSPIFFAVGNVPGSGKGLAVKVAAIIATGRDPGTTGYVRDSVEMGKRYASAALAGDRVLWLDDVEGTFGDASTCRTFTNLVLSERLLGTNEKPPLPMLATCWGTGNNVEFAGDVSRRVVPIRFVSLLAAPEGRADFKVPSLIAHVRDNRAKYVRAALTILRGFILAGRPLEGVAEFGSFEGWRGLVAGAVRWATGVDPLGVRAVFSAASDPRNDALNTLFDALEDLNAVSEESARRSCDLIDDLAVNEPKRTLLAVRDKGRDALDSLVSRKPGTPIITKTLGMALKRFDKRAIASPKNEKSGALERTRRLRSLSYSGTQHWWVEPISPPEAPPQAVGPWGLKGPAQAQGGESSRVNHAENDRGGFELGEVPQVPKVPRAEADEHPEWEPYWTLNTSADVDAVAKQLLAHPDHFTAAARVANDNAKPRKRPTPPCMVVDIWAWYSTHRDELERDAETGREAAQ